MRRSESDAFRSQRSEQRPQADKSQLLRAISEAHAAYDETDDSSIDESAIGVALDVVGAEAYPAAVIALQVCDVAAHVSVYGFPDQGVPASEVTQAAYSAARIVERAKLAKLLRDIFGNPFRPVTFSPSWRTSTAVALASRMYESRDFSGMPILGDALQDVGRDNTDILEHCGSEGPHVRGCWVVDLVLGKE